MCAVAHGVFSFAGVGAQEEMERRTMKCCECGKEFMQGNRPDGIPNGVSFMMGNGKMLTYCADCIIKVGQKQRKKEKKGRD